MPRFSNTSLRRMEGLHPDIIRVLTLAITRFDFLIIEGVRSDEQCYINWGKGRTVAQCAAVGCPTKYARPGEAKVTWLSHPLSSNHRKKGDGFGHAVDCGPSPLNWNDYRAFDRMAAVILECARELGVNLGWGGNWAKKDRPHFELA